MTSVSTRFFGQPRLTNPILKAGMGVHQNEAQRFRITEKERIKGAIVHLAD
jgi:hypothetical protein